MRPNRQSSCCALMSPVKFTNEALMRLALSRQAEGDLDRAGVAFLRVAPESPYLVQARIGGGHVFLTQGKYSEAIAALEPAFDQIENEKQLGSYHYLLGQAYSGQEEYRRAITHFTKALGLSLDSKLVEALPLESQQCRLCQWRTTNKVSKICTGSLRTWKMRKKSALPVMR